MSRSVRAAIVASAAAMLIPALASGVRSDGPRVIEISAKRYQFTPNEITLRKGEPVIIRLRSEDRTHGFFMKKLGIDSEVSPEKTTDVAITPEVAGTYLTICDHYCGAGHADMHMMIVVE